MELVDLYNKRREPLNKNCERGKVNLGEYSLSVHVWVLEDGKVWMQKRTKEKKMFPDMWEQSGGGVIAGETSIDAVKRESKEELGIELADDEITYIGSYTRTKDIVDIWMVQREMSKENIKLQEEEVQDVKLLSFEEIDKMIERKETVPTIEPSYNILKTYIKLYNK